MTECFLPPPGSPSEHRRVEHSSGLPRTPSSEEISPTKFPGLYRTGEPSPPHDSLHEPPDLVSDDEKDHGKKKGKFKKKEKRSKCHFFLCFTNMLDKLLLDYVGLLSSGNTFRSLFFIFLGHYFVYMKYHVLES